MAEALRPLVWAPKAERDLIDIWKFFAAAAKADVADDLLREIRRKADGLKDRPFSGRARPEIGPGLRSLLVHPHSIIYRVTEAGIEVARVLHQRRDLGAAIRKDAEKP